MSFGESNFMERMMGKQMGVRQDPRPARVSLEEALASEWGKPPIDGMILPAPSGSETKDGPKNFEGKFGFEDPLGR